MNVVYLMLLPVIFVQSPVKKVHMMLLPMTTGTVCATSNDWGTCNIILGKPDSNGSIANSLFQPTSVDKCVANAPIKAPPYHTQVLQKT